MNRQFHERLRMAIDRSPNGKTFDEKLDAVHAHVRSNGVTGVHSTKHTLRRWVTGRGVPPPYWVHMVATFLGVSVPWLEDGDGKMYSDGRTPPSAPKAPAGPPEFEKKGKVPEPTPEPEETDADPTVSIPAPEDVFLTKAADIKKFVQRTDSVEAIQAVLDAEPRNPNYDGGRLSVIREAEKALQRLASEEE